MKIKDIYLRYHIPPNLQDHMITVTKVSRFISSHWTQKNLNINQLILAALLHDLGNIVKFDFDNHPEFLGKEMSNISFWKQEQQLVISKYGNDDHIVTKTMLEEIGIEKNVIEVILGKSFGNTLDILKSDNFLSKILLYSDLRVLPMGIGPLKKRIEDIKSRLKKYKNRQDLFDASFLIEKQIQDNMDISIDEINIKNLNVDCINYLEIEA